MHASNLLHITGNLELSSSPKIWLSQHYETTWTWTMTNFPSLSSFWLLVEDSSHVTKRTLSPPLSVVLQSDVGRFCLAISHNVDTNCMIEGWLTRRIILTATNAELEEIHTIAWAYILGELKSLSTRHAVDQDNKNAMRCPMEIQNMRRHGTALPDYPLSLKKDSLLCCFAIKILKVSPRMELDT